MPATPSWIPAPRGAPKLEPESSRGLAPEGMAEAEFRVLTSGLGPRSPRAGTAAFDHRGRGGRGPWAKQPQLSNFHLPYLQRGRGRPGRPGRRRSPELPGGELRRPVPGREEGWEPDPSVSYTTLGGRRAAELGGTGKVHYFQPHGCWGPRFKQRGAPGHPAPLRPATLLP